MDPIQKTKDFFLFGQGFNLRKRDSRCKSNKKRSLGIPHPTQTKGDFFFHLFYFVGDHTFWRHGRAVRRGTANPFSPVQIRVSPDRQNSLFRFVDIKLDNLFSNRSKRGKRTLETCLILNSKHPQVLFFKML